MIRDRFVTAFRGSSELLVRGVHGTAVFVVGGGGAVLVYGLNVPTDMNRRKYSCPIYFGEHCYIGDGVLLDQYRSDQTIRTPGGCGLRMSCRPDSVAGWETAEDDSAAEDRTDATSAAALAAGTTAERRGDSSAEDGNTAR